MLLIPAIDLKNGQCVRLEQGEMQAATVFSTDPAAMARHWVEHERGADQLGIFAAASCGEMECLAEINSTHEHGGLTQTFLGIGGRRALSDHVKLMGAIDHQVNGPASMRVDVVYLGIQVTY